jgi:hypothetical protein
MKRNILVFFGIASLGLVGIEAVSYNLSCKTDVDEMYMQLLVAAVHRYKEEVGNYPSSLEDILKSNNPLELERIPKDAWGREFRYFMPARNSDAPYEIVSLGSDNEFGGRFWNKDRVMAGISARP